MPAAPRRLDSSRRWARTCDTSRGVLRILVLTLAACGSEATPRDPQADGACDQGWLQNGFETCDLGCEDSATALTASGTGCAALTLEASPVNCSKTFVFDGVTGCCSVDDTAVNFAKCE